LELLKREVVPSEATLRFLVFYSHGVKKDLNNPDLSDEQKLLALKVIAISLFFLF
jgi:hypothetical protein